MRSITAVTSCMLSLWLAGVVWGQSAGAAPPASGPATTSTAPAFTPPSATAPAAKKPSFDTLRVAVVTQDMGILNVLSPAVGAKVKEGFRSARIKLAEDYSKVPGSMGEHLLWQAVKNGKTSEILSIARAIGADVIVWGEEDYLLGRIARNTNMNVRVIAVSTGDTLGEKEFDLSGALPKERAHATDPIKLKDDPVFAQIAKYAGEVWADRGPAASSQPVAAAEDKRPDLLKEATADLLIFSHSSDRKTETELESRIRGALSDSGVKLLGKSDDLQTRQVNGELLRFLVRSQFDDAIAFGRTSSADLVIWCSQNDRSSDTSAPGALAVKLLDLRQRKLLDCGTFNINKALTGNKDNPVADSPVFHEICEGIRKAWEGDKFQPGAGQVASASQPATKIKRMFYRVDRGQPGRTSTTDSISVTEDGWVRVDESFYAGVKSTFRQRAAIISKDDLSKLTALMALINWEDPPEAINLSAPRATNTPIVVKTPVAQFEPIPSIKTDEIAGPNGSVSVSSGTWKSYKAEADPIIEQIKTLSADRDKLTTRAKDADDDAQRKKLTDQHDEVASKIAVARQQLMIVAAKWIANDILTEKGKITRPSPVVFMETNRIVYLDASVLGKGGANAKLTYKLDAKVKLPPVMADLCLFLDSLTVKYAGPPWDHEESR